MWYISHCSFPDLIPVIPWRLHQTDQSPSATVFPAGVYPSGGCNGAKVPEPPS
ncbi:hypothetical protein [Sphingobacterium cellulitidis]|uniref:hypothetical protein n=1 Tax=Sphingobacterium cellulitidis TaxID=1768011 RepID=UPI0015C624A2|nr:hypothetical protein [Sphingobacterium cellulitidis]